MALLSADPLPPSSHPPQDATLAPAPFRPLFIVGCERSGTTLLAVMLARHSRMAITPETHYLAEVYRRYPWQRLRLSTHRALLDHFWSLGRAADLNLDPDRLAQRFACLPATPRDLFHALLQEFAAGHGKPLVGEKSPVHLRYVPRLMQWFPHARVVCIVRDGRDVVQSLTRMPWTAGQSLRRQCLRWLHAARRTQRFLKRYPQRFITVRYEDLVTDPESVLRRVDAFADISFEPTQLSTADRTSVVPAWEAGWKARAQRDVGTDRIGLWRRDFTPDQQFVIHSMMHRQLRRLGYPVVEPPPCPFVRRFAHHLANLSSRLGIARLWSNTRRYFRLLGMLRRSPAPAGMGAS